MKILLLAPHPFYQERGTPIAVDLLIRALMRLDHHVDVLTYHEGENPRYDGPVTIHRIAPPRGVVNVRPGFSAKKLRCDAAMWHAALRLARTDRYDRVHAVEESVFMAMRINTRIGTPYVFDMDSSMPNQIADKLRCARPLLPILRVFERRAIRRATVVVPMCDALAQLARRAGAQRVTILRDVALVSGPELPTLGWRASLGCRGTVFLYLGNLEPYQGIDLLLDSFARTAKVLPDAALLIVGGRPDDIARHTERARMLGLSARVRLTGPQPLGAMGAVFAEADVLVSPRTQGENTPMKIYSYLASGKPTLATRLPTHTQVLDDRLAMLRAPDAGDFSDGMVALARDPSLRLTLANAAAHEARTRYSLDAFNRAVADIYPTDTGTTPPHRPCAA